MTTILTFGDSNTYGTPPMTAHGEHARFDATTRWPCVMQRACGCTLIEEGLPGRTAGPFTDPLMGPHMNGQLGLRIALQSHGPIDLLTIMLGTNDLKAHFGLTPQRLVAGVAGLIAIAQSEEYQTRHGGFQILLICPPAVTENGLLRAEFHGGAAKAAMLPALYTHLARTRGIAFLDAGQHIAVSDIDGVHFAPESQVKLGQAVAAHLLSFE